MSLDRFHQAQNAPAGGFATALAEIAAGHKRSHWIWYIFPQLAGLGRSSTAEAYALRNLEEACAYLQDAILRKRYAEIAAAVDGQLRRGTSANILMGGTTDALKLASSLTLFELATTRLSGDSGASAELASLADLCESILKRLEAQGYARCKFTLERCRGESPA